MPDDFPEIPRHPDGRIFTPDEIAEMKVDLDGICWNPTPRMTPYGEQDENGVDWSILRENLRLPPLERLRRGDEATSDAIRIRKYARIA